MRGGGGDARVLHAPPVATVVSAVGAAIDAIQRESVRDGVDLCTCILFLAGSDSLEQFCSGRASRMHDSPRPEHVNTTLLTHACKSYLCRDTRYCATAIESEARNFCPRENLQMNICRATSLLALLILSAEVRAIKTIAKVYHNVTPGDILDDLPRSEAGTILFLVQSHSDIG